MIYLLLGKDSFGKKEYVAALRAAKPSADLAVLDNPATEREIELQASGGSLFSKDKFVVVTGALQKLDSAKLIDALTASTDTIVFIEDSLDKRKKETKALLTDKRIETKEFAIPSGPDFVKWLIAHAKKLGLDIDAKIAGAIARRLGDDGRNDIAYDLWQAENELRKLRDFADGAPLTVADVNALIAESIDDDIFKVTNAIADRNSALAAQYLTDFIDRSPGADEKSNIINLSAVIAEQFRGMYAFAGLLADGAGDSEIATRTGYTPGRVFVYKKILRTLPAERLLEALRKLEALDVELKTSSGPATLQFFMIIQGLMR